VACEDQALLSRPQPNSLCHAHTQKSAAIEGNLRTITAAIVYRASSVRRDTTLPLRRLHLGTTAIRDASIVRSQMALVCGRKKSQSGTCPFQELNSESETCLWCPGQCSAGFLPVGK
jgi:hypothetical protein